MWAMKRRGLLAQAWFGRHGKYVADGTCDGKTFYKCKDCSSPDKQYLYYSSKYDDWNIGPEGCGSTLVGLLTDGSNSGDLGRANWYEWSGDEWVRTSSISVSCNTRTGSRSMTPKETGQSDQVLKSKKPVYELSDTPTTPNADEPVLAPTPSMPKEEPTAVPTPTYSSDASTESDDDAPTTPAPTAGESDGAYTLGATGLAAAMVLAFA
jgi:hypothetical protein